MPSSFSLLYLTYVNISIYIFLYLSIYLSLPLEMIGMEIEMKKEREKEVQVQIQIRDTKWNFTSVCPHVIFPSWNFLFLSISAGINPTILIYKINSSHLKNTWIIQSAIIYFNWFDPTQILWRKQSRYFYSHFAHEWDLSWRCQILIHVHFSIMYFENLQTLTLL